MSNLRLLAEAKIWTHKGRVFLTDFPGVGSLDAVFPLCPENRYFADHLKVVANSRVLDLCTGCGIFAIFSAQKAREVVAVDINPRAIEFAELNAALNGVSKKISFRIGDLFEPVKGEVFDLITVNPPFEPIPDGFNYYAHSDGGPSGMDVIQRICENVEQHISPQGIFQIIGYFSSSICLLINEMKSIFSTVMVDEVAIVNREREKFQKHLNQQLLDLNLGRTVPKPASSELTYVFITATMNELSEKKGFGKQKVGSYDDIGQSAKSAEDSQ